MQFFETDSTVRMLHTPTGLELVFPFGDHLGAMCYQAGTELRAGRIGGGWVVHHDNSRAVTLYADNGQVARFRSLHAAITR